MSHREVLEYVRVFRPFGGLVSPLLPTAYAHSTSLRAGRGLYSCAASRLRRCEGKTEIIRGNVGARTTGRKLTGARDEMEAQRARALARKNRYKRPWDRNLLTGSTTGSACRRKIQRATAKPIAA